MPRRLLLLGEGERDIGRIGDGRRRPPCSFEGDLPRLVRRLAETLLLETRFGYDANTFRRVVAQIRPRDGRPTRVGGKAKDLRDALVYSLGHDPSAIVAVVDVREEEFTQLQADATDVVAQCSERRTDIPVVIGLALHEIEISLLADSHARSAAFGEKVAGHALPEGRLEAIRDPKTLWASLSGQLPPARTSPAHLAQRRSVIRSAKLLALGAAHADDHDHDHDHDPRPRPRSTTTTTIHEYDDGVCGGRHA